MTSLVASSSARATARVMFTAPAPPYSDSNAADGDSDRNDSGAEDGNYFV
jgi:hypothetical protein